MKSDAARPHSSLFTLHSALTLGWSVYLACSWTWCIGMFLPVLMVRDFGVAGWVVFAFPNIVGAAALGWVLSRPGAASRIVAEHGAACQVFSGVTIAFQCFFVGWLVRALVGWAAPAIFVAAVLLLILVMRGGRRELICAAVIFAISVAMFIAAFVQRPAGLPVEAIPPGQGLNLLWLSPVVVFGFLLCPYLDLTFLRARAMTKPKQGVAAFTIGFGLFFLLMILFTLWYAPLLQAERFDHLRRAMSWTLAIHLTGQTAFTVALHARPLAAKDARASVRIGSLVFAIVAILIPIVLMSPSTGMTILAAARGERVYRLFMGFYGLVFPAYVWICMIPARRLAWSRASISAKWMVFGIAVAIAAPMFWLGFIAGRMIWLVPGLAVVLLARLALPIMSDGMGRMVRMPAVHQGVKG